MKTEKQLDNSYKILGINKKITLEELKKIYKTLIKEYHPDRIGTNETAIKLATEKVQEINKAYEQIKEILENYENEEIDYDEFKFLGKVYDKTNFDSKIFEYANLQKITIDKVAKIKAIGKINNYELIEGAVLSIYLDKLSTACVKMGFDVSGSLIYSLISEKAQEIIEEAKKLKNTKGLIVEVYTYFGALLSALELEPDSMFDMELSARIMELMEKYEQEQKKLKLCEAFEAYPFNLNIYRYIIEIYGDSKRELEKLEEIFKINILSIKYEIFNKAIENYKKNKNEEQCFAEGIRIGIPEKDIKLKINETDEKIELESLQILEIGVSFENIEKAREIHKMYKDEIKKLIKLQKQIYHQTEVKKIESLIKVLKENDIPDELKLNVIQNLENQKNKLKKERIELNNRGDKKKKAAAENRQPLIALAGVLFYIFAIYSWVDIETFMGFLFKYVLLIPFGSVIVGIFIFCMDVKNFIGDSHDPSDKKFCMNCGKKLNNFREPCDGCGELLEYESLYL